MTCYVSISIGSAYIARDFHVSFSSLLFLFLPSSRQSSPAFFTCFPFLALFLPNDEIRSFSFLLSYLILSTPFRLSPPSVSLPIVFPSCHLLTCQNILFLPFSLFFSLFPPILFLNLSRLPISFPHHGRSSPAHVSTSPLLLSLSLLQTTLSLGSRDEIAYPLRSRQHNRCLRKDIFLCWCCVF